MRKIQITKLGKVLSRYQEFLKGKDIKIWAQGKLISEIQKRHNIIEKQLRCYSEGKLYTISKNHKQLKATNRLNNDAKRVLRDAQIKEDAVVKTLIFKENVNTPDNMTDGASSLPPKDNNRNGSSVSITITENSTSGENYKSVKDFEIN